MNTPVDRGPDEVSTIADGRAAKDGAFVRMFFDWHSAVPGVIACRARYDGRTYNEYIRVDTLAYWLSPKIPEITAWIDGLEVLVSRTFLDKLPGQIQWMLNTRAGQVSGPCPGE